tara:strand:- start:29077 stop:29352 length:276 start_codon:yes stop_codon:yes gene_type:complete
MTVINKTQKINSMMDEVAAKSAEDFIEKLDKQLGDLYQLLNDAKESFNKKVISEELRIKYRKKFDCAADNIIGARRSLGGDFVYIVPEEEL